MSNLEMDSEAALTVGGARAILWLELPTPLTHEFPWRGAEQRSTTLPIGLPDSARYVLADVFLTAADVSGLAPINADHQNIELGRAPMGTRKNWVDTSGNRPSAEFGEQTVHSVILTIPGESDNFRPHHGTWHSALFIPIARNRVLYWGNHANSGSNGWVYMRIRAFSF
jgi:hypothetical protein